MKLTTVLLIITFMEVSAASHGQALTLSGRNVSLSRVISEIRRQTGYGVLVSTTRINTSTQLSLNFKNTPLRDVLNKITEDLTLSYSMEDRTIVIWPRAPVPAVPIVAAAPVIISGKVTDEDGQPLQGVTVTAHSTGNVIVTGADGSFKIQVEEQNELLVFSYVGYQTVEVRAKDGANVNVVLKQQKKQMEEVRIIGYGEQAQKKISTAVSRADGKYIGKQPVSTPGAATRFLL